MTAPKLRFKEFYGDWKITVLGKLASHISYGLTVRPEYIDEGIKLISAREIASGEIDLISAPKISTDDFEKLSDKAKPQKNDLFLSKTGSIGFTAIVDTDEELAITQNIAVIRLNDMEKQIPLFYLHQMRTSSFQRKAISVVNQSTIMDLQLGDIKKIEVSYCNDKEQTKIASFLSAVDEKISQLTQKHRLLCEYKQGMMQKLFSQQLRFKADDGSDFGEWEETTLKNCITSIDSGWSPQCESYSTNLNEWGVLKTTSVDWNGFNAYFNKKLPDKLTPRPELEVQPLDILVTRAGPTDRVGVVAVVPEEVRSKLMISDKLIRLKANEKSNPIFLGISLSLVKCQNQLQSKTSGLAKSQTNISQKILNDVLLTLPSKEEQTKIANFLSAINQKIEVVAEQIEQAKVWKKGLLQQMFV